MYHAAITIILRLQVFIVCITTDNRSCGDGSEKLMHWFIVWIGSSGIILSHGSIALPLLHTSDVMFYKMFSVHPCLELLLTAGRTVDGCIIDEPISYPELPNALVYTDRDHPPKQRRRS